MKPTISVIIPSRDRPQGLLRAIESIRATQGDYEVEIVAVLDEPDLASQAIVFGLPGVKVVVSGPGDFYLGKPQDKFNLGYAAATGEWVVSGSDDITFDSPGWIDECLSVNRGGFVGLSDGGHDPRNYCVLVMASRWYIENVMRGKFGLPWYHIWWADVEWAERAKIVGLYAACSTLKLTHYHWARGTAVADRIALLARELAPADEVTYGRRAKQRFADDEV
jgi:glycosyltransferase involved in cell wall biosynthesis